MESNNSSTGSIPRVFSLTKSTLRFIGIVLFSASLAACNSGSSGSGGTDAGPVQNATSVVTEVNRSVTIDVISAAIEEKGAPIAGDVMLSIEAAPEHGTAVILDDNNVAYTPGADYVGQDSFMFKVADDSGTFAVGTISIGIVCSDCAPDPSESLITLSWIPLPDTTLTYIVYFGDSPTTADTVASETQASEAVFHLTDLGLQPGDTLCFRLRARNDLGMSGFSEPVCSIV